MTVSIDKGQIQLVAEVLKNMPATGKGLNFYSFNIGGVETFASDLYPPLDHPHALKFFFFAVMHDFGFWYGDDRGYLAPLYGIYKGKESKGSDLMWKALTTVLWLKTEQFDPAFLADISPKDLAKMFSDDNGPIPFPDFETRLQLTRAYGRWFVEEGSGPADILLLANKSDGPLEEFIYWVRQLPGYNRDPFDKKNFLLAMVLANRPEEFLKVKDPQNWRPILDYHLMRLALRLGMVELSDNYLFQNTGRKWVNSVSEWGIRLAVYRAIGELIRKSGRSMFFVDEKMWMGREYCPEMTVPVCSKCIFEPVCKKRIKLFQPVFRTTNY